MANPILKHAFNHPPLFLPRISLFTLSTGNFQLSKLQARIYINGGNSILECRPVSAAAAAASSSDLVVEFLVDTLGFSTAEAVAIAAKVGPFKSKQRPASVAHFFEQVGFSQIDIRAIVSSVPKILRSSVQKNLAPKIAAFQEVGISGSDLAKFITNNPQIIETSLNAAILPAFDLMRSIFASDEENMIRAIKKGVWVLNSPAHARRNIELLRSYDVSDQRIQKFLLRFPKTFYVKPKCFEDVLLRVEEELGIPRQSAMFMYGVDALAAMSKETLESKYEMFKSYGWSQSDVLTLSRKLPSCLRLSDSKLEVRLNFFMNELGFDAEYLASHPALLKLSLEHRILPRMAVMRILKESMVMESKLSFWTVMALTDAEFLKRFVLEYKDVLPHLSDVYTIDKDLDWQTGYFLHISTSDRSKRDVSLASGVRSITPQQRGSSKFCASNQIDELQWEWPEESSPPVLKSPSSSLKRSHTMDA